MLRSFSTLRSLSTASELIVRNAVPREVHLATKRAVQDGWHVGPHDYPALLAFDPRSFYIGEVNGELVLHFCVVEFPKHHYFSGGMVVTEKFRRRGYNAEAMHRIRDHICNPNYTIGFDIRVELLKSHMDILGSVKHWDTYRAMLNFNKVLANTADSEDVQGVVTKPIREANIGKLLEYDHAVFGAPRRELITRWMNIPGSFGWVAERNTDIVGYTIIRHVIREAGSEIGLAMSPLYADCKLIAKLLLKTAAEYSLMNDAVPKTDIELFLPVGNHCVEDGIELMNELEADVTHYAYRTYTKGVPPGRQGGKIYGILSPSCD